MPQDFDIALGHTAADWKRLKLDPHARDTSDWKTAIAMLRARMEDRFFSPVQLLIDTQVPCKQVHGFVVLAIDCLRMEMLQGFRKGLKDHKGKSGELFERFLVAWPVFPENLPATKAASAWAREVYVSCRCALLHSGCSNGFTVGISGEAFTFDDEALRDINRTKLHAEIELVYNAYFEDLLKSEKSDLRANFLRMDVICAVATREES
ncbi:hypothetical protein [Hyphomicrobium sp. CS1GBMeth3]|uniref:hypothetical protein n=1 Tax=Hyphomicrobium sp. CS1GBMeth3 TaxID=1892845 RepID=UPI000930797C|nr:hypothetical protein [Hyphomicrobium sp. CS1GBMeth3]